MGAHVDWHDALLPLDDPNVQSMIAFSFAVERTPRLSLELNQFTRLERRNFLAYTA